METTRNYLKDYRNSIALVFPNQDLGFKYPNTLYDDQKNSTSAELLSERATLNDKNYDSTELGEHYHIGCIIPHFLVSTQDKRTIGIRDLIIPCENPHFLVLTKEQEIAESMQAHPIVLELVKNGMSVKTIVVEDNEESLLNSGPFEKILDRDNKFIKCLDITAKGCVVVRPDSHIYWKAKVL